MSDRIDSPQALVAIARAARLAGDMDLSRVAVRQLADDFGIEIHFRREKPEKEAIARAGDSIIAGMNADFEARHQVLLADSRQLAKKLADLEGQP